jgi:hypothetical protein
MKLERFGFFDELDDKARQGVLSTRSAASSNAKILEYLRKGIRLITIPGIVKDLLSDDNSILGSAHVLTDGKWAWTINVNYYDEHYNLQLPKEFLENMEVNSWTIPDKESIELESLEVY